MQHVQILCPICGKRSVKVLQSPTCIMRGADQSAEIRYNPRHHHEGDSQSDIRDAEYPYPIKTHHDYGQVEIHIHRGSASSHPSYAGCRGWKRINADFLMYPKRGECNAAQRDAMFPLVPIAVPKLASARRTLCPQADRELTWEQGGTLYLARRCHGRICRPSVTCILAAAK